MNELNINKCIIQKRKEKGLTQEDLAEYIGVSNAAVSKWESHRVIRIFHFFRNLQFFNVSSVR